MPSSPSQDAQSSSPLFIAPDVDPIYLAVLILHGRDLAPVFHSQALENHLLTRVMSLGDRPIIVRQFSILGDEYARGRNDTVAMVLAYEQEHHIRFHSLLWIDDDVVIPEGGVEKLLSHNLPIVSGLYFMRRPPFLPVAYRKATEPGAEGRFWNLDSYPPADLITVDAVGCGMLLIRRDVYDHLPKPWYAWRPLDWSPETADRSDMNTLGEDIYWCSRAAQAGYQVFLDTAVKCGHVGTHVFGESIFISNQMAYRRTPAPGKLSILFLPQRAPKPWDYNTLSLEGLGGSESAVAYLAHQMANRHHHTPYVVSGAAPNVIENVHYRPYEALGLMVNHPWDVAIVSRYSDILPVVSENNGIGLVIFWSHDLLQIPQIRFNYQYANVYAVVSPFHAAFTFHQCPENVPGVTTEAIMPNGVDNSLFLGEEERQFGKLIWTSNPNRGLPTAVRILKRLRKRFGRQMELHVYGRASVYGWAPDHEAAWVANIDEPGVYLHEPLPKRELARELMRSWAMLYSTHWPETFGIAMLEAQAAGTPVITNPYGALVDTVEGGVLGWDFEAMVESMLDPVAWELASLRGKAFAARHDWTLISDRWEQLIQSDMKKG